MPRPGSRRSRRKSSAEAALAATLAIAALLAAGPARADEAGTVAVEGDAIPRPLTGEPGDPTRGRAIVASRQKGLCLLCHPAPIPEERFQGNLAPDLAGVGSRLTEGQLRLRLVDGRRLNPDTIMPSYHRTEGLERVGPAWRGRTVLTAQEIEDVVAFLAGLRD